MTPAETLAALRLYRSERIGAITFRALYQQFGSYAAALEAVPELARRGGGRKLKLALTSSVKVESEQIEKAGGCILALGSANFPRQLAVIDSAAPLLTVLGHSDLLHRQQIAMVGARNASPNGQRLAGKIASDLSAEQLVITSGLARGIDTAAHEASVAGGTIAVLAGGADKIYPQENRELYYKILDQGAIVSEMPWGVEPAARLFPKRNRIIAGLTLGVVLVEAKRQSGSMITAKAAAEFGRAVFAVPGAPYDPRSQGCNDLIRDGAVLTRYAGDVLQDINLNSGFEVGEVDQDFDGPTPPPYDETAVDLARSAILDILTPYPTLVDDLIQQCQVSPRLAQAALLELELAGRLDRHPGGKVSLIADLNFDF